MSIEHLSESVRDQKTVRMVTFDGDDTFAQAAAWKEEILAWWESLTPEQQEQERQRIREQRKQEEYRHAA